jgi:hypothetical protein
LPWHRGCGSAKSAICGNHPPTRRTSKWDIWLDLRDSHDWASVIAGRPEFAGRCDWKKFDATDWVTILAAQPQFATECDKVSQYLA